MKKQSTVLALTFPLLLLGGIGMSAQEQPKALPKPTPNQLRWQDMEMYAFIHYSLNTYTDQEWGFGNESPQLFNPADLDCRQWARACKQAGMRGIILTAKHHCGFCLWPSKYTDYSVKNAPWKNGKGDVVRELADACREEGLQFAVYLSPWDRNHPEYGRPAYITYFRNQLRELLTNYGDIFEVWFDGANGGDGWYGGANEVRRIDRKTYYEWPETYRMIRELQPKCLIWNDGSDRGDLRWVGNEAGSVGETNWSMLNKDGDVTSDMLRHGQENGDSWVAAETNTSIRPGWFYHETENENVKSLSKLMDTYYKSVGRNSCLLLNFPIAPNGRIHPTDSLRGIAFKRMIDEVFRENLIKETHPVNTPANALSYIIDIKEGASFNRFLVEEDIAQGQRVKRFTLQAFVDGEWLPLKDALSEQGDGLTTIGHRRIICFPTVKATKLRFTVTEAKAEPVIKRFGVYLAPDISSDTPDAGEKHSSDYHIFFGADKMMFVDLPQEQTVTAFRYLPPQESHDGIVTHYRISATTDWSHWETIGEGEFSNIVNNPIWQTVRCKPTRAKVIRVEALRLAQGSRMGYSDVEVISE
jgi:alpha-L-fucosidase